VDNNPFPPPVPNFIAVLPHSKILFILAFLLVLFFFKPFCNEMIFGMNIWYFDYLTDILQT